MRNTLFLSLTTFLMLASCSQEKQKEISAPEGMMWYSLQRYGKPFSLAVPDTNTTKLEVQEQPDGSLHLRAGKNFAISIRESAGDIALIKSDISSDGVNKLLKIHRSADSLLLWESSITSPEFHFVLNRNLGGETFCFEDVRENQFGQNEIERMVQSSSNIKVSAPAN